MVSGGIVVSVGGVSGVVVVSAGGVGVVVVGEFVLLGVVVVVFCVLDSGFGVGVSTTGVAGTGVCNGDAVCGHTPVGAEPEVEVLACHIVASLSFGGTVL